MSRIIEIVRQPSLDLKKLHADSLEDTIPGYPSPSTRLTFTADEWQEKVANGIDFEHGPHFIDLPSRYAPGTIDKIDHIITPDNPATPEQLARWQGATLKTTLGVPLHPLVEIGLTTVFEDGSTIGMFTGPGRLWHLGPSLIGNLGLRRVCQGQAEYLTIAVERRSGKRVWSLPGGHAEGGQTAYDAALDEGWQETGIPADLLADLPGHMVQTVPSLFGPNTAMAWLDERYLMLDAEGVDNVLQFIPKPRDTEEVVDCKWMSIEAMKALGKKVFLGSHLVEIEAFESTRKAV